MKVGLFGGTFNPIHNGHIRIIQYVKQCHGLDRICFIVSASPPHKPDIRLAPARDRYDMVRKSIEPFRDFYISDIELRRNGPSFTVDTVNAFISTKNRSTDFYLIVGSDAFFEMETWKDYDTILKTLPVIVMQRAGQKKSMDKIAAYIENHLSAGYRISDHGCLLSHDRKKTIYICNTPEIAISSTDIRKRIQQKMPIHHLVPEHVETMIIEKGLYQ